MELYYENLNYLKKNASDLHDTVKFEKDNISVRIVKKLKRNYLVKTEEATCFLNSIYNSDNEMNMMFANVNRDVKTVVLFGIGNGEAIRYIVKTFKGIRDLVVIEPSLELFKLFLNRNDIQEVLRSGLNISLVINKDVDFSSSYAYLKLIDSTENAVVSHVSYCSLFNTYRNEMVKSLKKRLTQRRMGLNASSDQWKLWILNTIMNMKVDEIYSVEELTKQFKDKVIILVAAGPSLDKNYMWIEKMKDKAIVIAAGTGVKKMDERGLVPDIRVALDPFNSEKRALETRNTDDAILIYANQLYHEILPNYEGEKLNMVLSSDRFTKYIYDKVNIEYTECLSGASVINCILNLVCDADCKKVVFMGQDLSYSKNEVNINDTEYSEVKSVSGETIYTTDVFRSMRYSIESTIMEHPKIEFLNATEGGLMINGARNITAKDVVERHLINEEELHKDNWDFSNKESRRMFKNKINVGIKLFRDELEEIIELQKELQKYLSQLKLNGKDVKKIKAYAVVMKSLMNKIEDTTIYKELIGLVLEINIKSIELKYKDDMEKDETRIILNAIKILENKIALISEFIKLTTTLIDGEVKIEVFNK